MLNALGLGILFEAKDSASEVVERLEHSLHGVHKAAEGAHKGVLSALGGMSTIVAGAAVAVGAIGAGAAFEFAEHAEKFSSAILRAGVASHATAEQMKELEEFAKTKSLDSLRGSAIETAEVLKQLALEGYDAQDAMKAFDGTMTLMRISSLDARSAAGLVNDTLGQFNMHAGDAGELTDKLAFAMKTFGFRAEELQGTMSGLAAGARLTNASLDDTLIGVGLIKSVFPSATKAAAAMNTAMNQLADKQHQQVIAQKLGISVVDQHTKQMRPLIDIMRDLSLKTSKMSEAQLSQTLQMIGGGRAAGGLAAIIDGLRKGVKDSNGQLLTGADALEFYRNELNQTSGTAKKMAAMLGGDLGGAIEALKGALSNLGVQIGLGGPEGFFTKAIQDANLFVRAITQLFSQGGFSGEVKDALEKKVGIKAFAENVFMWVKRIENFFDNLSASFKASFAPFQPILDQLLDTFGALGMALGFTSQTADENAATWDRFGGAGSTVGATLANIAGIIIPILNAAVFLMIGAVEIAKESWNQFGGVVTGLWNILSGVFKLIAGLFTGNWKMMWDGFVDVCAGAAKIVVNIVMGLIGWFAKLIDSVGSAFGTKFGLAKEIDEIKKDWTGSLVEGSAVIKSVVSPNPTSPAGAAIQGQAAATAAATAPLISMAGGANGEQVTHHHVSVHLDGEKVGETLASSRRSLRARSFEPVTSAHEGGF